MCVYSLICICLEGGGRAGGQHLECGLLGEGQDSGLDEGVSLAPLC